MRQKVSGKQTASEKLVKDIRQKTRKIYSAEEKIRIVLDGLGGEMSISELCRREGRSCQAFLERVFLKAIYKKSQIIAWTKQYCFT